MVERSRTDRNKHNFLVVITTNADRDLSPAFRRRCLPIKIEPPNLEQAAWIGRTHLNRISEDIPNTVPTINDTQLIQLAQLETMNSTDINVSGYIDLIDAAVGFPNVVNEWETFVELMTDFSNKRRSLYSDN